MKIAKTRVVEVKRLTPSERAELEPRLVDIYLQSYDLADRRTIAERVVFRHPEARLLLCYDAGGALAGFTSAVVEPFKIDGRNYGVIDSGGYSRADIRGAGAFALRFLMVAALRFKLRHPRSHVCFVGEVASPASYKRTMHMPVAYPRRGVSPPADVSALVRAVMRQRGMALVDDDPWRVRLDQPCKLRDVERITRFATRDDPDVAFYLERNPGYLDGHWLAFYCAADLRDVLGTTVSLLRSSQPGER